MKILCKIGFSWGPNGYPALGLGLGWVLGPDLGPKLGFGEDYLSLPIGTARSTIKLGIAIES